MTMFENCGKGAAEAGCVSRDQDLEDAGTAELFGEVGRDPAALFEFDRRANGLSRQVGQCGPKVAQGSMGWRTMDLPSSVSHLARGPSAMAGRLTDHGLAP